MLVSTIVILNLTIFNNIFLCSPDFLYFLSDNSIQICEPILSIIPEEFKKLNFEEQSYVVTDIIVNIYIEEIVKSFLETNNYELEMEFFEEKLFDLYIEKLINFIIKESNSGSPLSLENTHNFLYQNCFNEIDLEFYLYQIEDFYNHKSLFIYKLFPEFVPDYALHINNVYNSKKSLLLVTDTDLEDFHENPILLFFSSQVYIDNLNLIKWISYLFDSIYFGFIIDNLSLLMLVIVLTISTLVHYYSIDYMATDP